MLTSILIAIPVWLVLALLTTNLIGLTIRGFFPPIPARSNPESPASDIIAKEISRAQNAGSFVGLVALVMLIGFVFALAIFWNIGLAIAALTLMLSRLPSLVWEVKYGHGVPAHEMGAATVFTLATGLGILSIPIVWYSIYVGLA